MRLPGTTASLLKQKPVIQLDPIVFVAPFSHPILKNPLVF